MRLSILPFLLHSLVFTNISSPVHGGRYGIDTEGMSLEEILEAGDETLSSNDPLEAINIYKKGIELINPEEDSLLTALSLYTNAGTAYSSTGDERQAVAMYANAIRLYSKEIEEIVDESIQKYATDIVAQAAFFLGMTHEALENYRKAADSYAYAAQLDEYHWAALANLGALLQDHLKVPAEALQVYNKAYDILTQTDVEPTDPPEQPKLVLSQLQYRIGLAITYSENQKCVMQNDPDTVVPCSEMAASAFNYALELDPTNESAKHMLASVTADATMRRASNTYVTQLFEDYAEK